MELSRTKNVIRNIISTLFMGLIATILPFFVRTYTIKYLGSEYMGLNNLCASVLTVLSATDLGVANAFAFRLYRPIAQGDRKEVCKLLNFYRKVYFVIGMVILAIGIIILPFIKLFISQNVPKDVNVYVIFFLYLINTVISYSSFSYKSLIFIAEQRKDYESLIVSISFGILYLSQIVLIYMRQYFLSICVLPLCTMFENILRNLVAKNKYPDYIPSGTISKSEKMSLKKDIFSVAIYKFRDISRNAFDNIVISTFMGLVMLSNYQNYYTILTVPVWLLTVFYTSVLPSVGNFVVSNGREEIYGIYKKNAFIMSFIAAWFAICFGFLIQDFITIWLGADFRLSQEAVILFSVYIYLQGEAMIIKIMRESIGLWKQGKVWAGIEMVTNLMLNVLLVIWIGVEGIILATIISMLFISIPVENRIIFKKYFVGKGRDKIISMIIYAIWAINTSVIVGVACYFAPNIQYISFIYKVFACVIIPPLSCFLFFHRTEELQFVRNTLVSLLGGH